ncbi:uncharacterized protein JCM10292_003962 [Rhodotorula paludigena]|uniref:uncharacterized protein n=1 Tax=Rhodotorula paludigena TaxID=86838 RepID=UPI00316D3944
MTQGSGSVPWALTTSAPSSQPLSGPPDPSTPPHFSSSFGAFGLPPPRSNPSNLTIALQGGAATGLGPFGTLAPGTPGGSGATSGGCNALGYPVPSARRPSMLAADTAMNWDDQGDSQPDAIDGGIRQDRTNSGGDEMMSLSPGPDTHLPPPLTAPGLRQTRSRSGSGSAPMLLNPAAATSLPPQLYPFSSIPPSPVTVARALQAGQKTPPPFLQRRLFKEDGEKSATPEETASASGRSSRSGSSSDVGSGLTRSRAMRVATMSSAVADEDEEIEELSAVLSRSASAGPEDAFERVVRRPVSRKPNLLPKPKSHLRILSELRSEASGDQAEITSEAALHRLSRAGAAAPSLRSSCPPSLDSKPVSASAPASSRAMPPPTRPTPNRFPEQADEDDPLTLRRADSSSSSNDDVDEAAEVGSDWGGMSIGGYGTEDEEERRTNVVWNGIRSGPSGSAVTVATPTTAGRSPGSGSRHMELETPFAAPQTPSTFSGRPGKRKMNDDRFEPYAHQALKRRAVSPAASLSLSPGFIAASAGMNSMTHPSSASSSSSRPTPPPLPASSLAISTSSHTQPVSIPSPTAPNSHHNFFSSISAAGAGAPSGTGTRSLAGSPAAASSLSSSTGGGLGRGFTAFALSDRHRPISATEERERLNAAMRLDPEGLGRMSLGGGEEQL